jgi:hypothetical protein
MEIQRAAALGLLQRTLKIEPNVRIAMRLTDGGGVDVWDLSSGKMYRIMPGNVLIEDHPVPANVKEIVATSDDVLRKRLRDTWQQGWTEERQTIFTECSIVAWMSSISSADILGPSGPLLRRSSNLLAWYRGFQVLSEA